MYAVLFASVIELREQLRLVDEAAQPRAEGSS